MSRDRNMMFDAIFNPRWRLPVYGKPFETVENAHKPPNVGIFGAKMTLKNRLSVSDDTLKLGLPTSGFWKSAKINN